MLSKNLVLLSSLAAASAQTVAQGIPPPVSRLTMTMSGVLPVAPTPFPGVDTLEGAIINDGPAMPGFVGLNGNATAQTGNPQTSYRAVLPTQQFDPYFGSTIQGSIVGAAAANGTGVMFTINFTMLPNEAMYGPFVYHIHNLPISADGNCTTSMGHLDPTNRGELYSCDVANPQSCQVGDLSGKHGNITTTSFQASYLDPYFSTTPGSPYFFGDKSIVIHSSNVTRITCANFSMAAVVSSSSMASSMMSMTSATSAAAGTAVAGPVPAAQGSDGQLGGTVPAAPRVTVTTSTSTSRAASATTSAPAAFTGAANKGDAGLMGLAAGVAGALAFLL